MTVEAIVNDVRALEREGRWDEVKAMGMHALSTVTSGEGVARLHSAIATATFHTIRNADDWQRALNHARLAHEHAPTATPFHAYTLHKLASLSVDMGRFEDARKYAAAYMQEEPKHSEILAPFTAYVQRDLALVAESKRRFASAASLARKAMHAFEALGADDEAIRTATYIAWFNVKAGRVQTARAVLPSSVPDSIEYLREGALAAILAAEGRYDEALRAGRRAIECGKRSHFDYVDAAEIALILGHVSHKLGKHAQAMKYLGDADRFSRRQNDRSVYALVVSAILGERGGDFSLDDQAIRGCASLRIALSAAFCSGVG